MQTSSVLFDYKSLSQNGHTIVEYIWLGGYGDDIRSKSRTFNKEINFLKDIPVWNFDGSSTGQAQTEESEINIVPVALFDDPFRGKPNKLALCETYYTNGQPTLTNFRYFAKKVFSQQNIDKFDPWFGIEQEYILLKYIGTDLKWPLGWTPGEYLAPQGQYYCSNGSQYSYGREIVEAHMKACLYAGVKFYGINAEVSPSQWEYQIGTCPGIEVSDHLIIARFLMQRVAEKFGVAISLEPKLFKNWNGSGSHTNFSNKQTREDSNLKEIKRQVNELSKYHKDFIYLYGEGNEERLSGNYETSDINTFTFGVMNRKASVRIPKSTEQIGRGYYEDRRPSSNCDPYIVSAIIFSVTCLDGKIVEEIKEVYNRFLVEKKNLSHCH